MKRLFKSLLVFVLFVSLSAVFVVKANPTINFKSEAIKSYTDVVTTDLYGVATINQTTITSYNKRVIQSSKLADHKTHWIEPNVSLDNSDLRIVNYTAGSATNWDGKKPTELAKIYEEENPGWIVVGGTNGDFFHISDNSEVLGTSMQEGHFYKPYSNYNGGHMAIGFDNDGRYVYGLVDKTDKQYVQILGSDGKYTDVAMINDVDDKPTETGVTLLTRFAICNTPYKDVAYSGTLPYDVTGYTVYKVIYETQRYDRSGSSEAKEHRVYVKGVISEIVNNLSTLEIDDATATSYLVSKDGSLDSLKVGDEIRCQCKLEGEWEGLTNITIFYNQILKNGEVLDYNTITDFDTSYVNAIKNRTVMGFKADGTPIMMVVEKGTYGASYEECGEFLKGLGCVNGFLFDGGGSSCIFVRDNNGGFTTLNKHEDGNERSDGNAMFFVKRDPGFEIKVDNIERFSATVKLDITNQEFFNELSNVKVTVNGVTKDYDANGINFDGLEETTDYQVKVSYKINKHPEILEVVESSQTRTFTTHSFEVPKHGLSIDKINHDSFVVKKNTELETSSWIQNVIVHVGRGTYNMGNKDEVFCDNLDKDTEYEVYFEYTVVDPASGKEYHLTSNPQYIYTLPFSIPSIVSFEEARKGTSTLSISYEYLDDDKVVEKAYVLVNGEVAKEVTIKSGSISLTGLDYEANEYTIKLVIEYLDAEGKTIKVESDALEYLHEQVTPEPAPAKKKCGKKSAEIIIAALAATSVAYVFLRKRK